MAASHQPLTDRDRELLSAYLDGELSDRERNTLERRLTQERALQNELNALRDTVALLRDLPPLKAPRDFTLDPALYRRARPWWQRLVTFENSLQLTGALGAAASVVLIVLALLVNNGDLIGETHRDDDFSAGVALLPTDTPLPTVTMLTEHLDQTAIAYAGEDLIQTTIIAQSTLYAFPTAVPGTPQPESAAVGAYGDASGEADDGVLMFDEAAELELDSSAGDQPQANGAAEGAAPEVAAAPLAADAPDSPAAAESADVQTFSAAPSEQSEEAASPMTPTAVASSGSSTNAPTGGAALAATPVPDDTAIDAADADSAQALREGTSASESEAPEPDADAELGAAASPPITGADTEAPAAIEEQEPATKTREAASDNDTTPDAALLLAVAGVIIFILSMGMLVIGRKKAPRS